MSERKTREFESNGPCLTQEGVAQSHTLEYFADVPRPPAPERGVIVLGSAALLTALAILVLVLSAYTLLTSTNQREGLPAAFFAAFTAAILILETLSIIARSGKATTILIALLALFQLPLFGNIKTSDLNLPQILVLLSVSLLLAVITMGHLRWWFRLRKYGG